MTANTLRSAADLQVHANLRIEPEWLVTFGVRRVTDREARDLLGISRTKPGDFSGLLYPGFHPLTGAVRNHRVRRDSPELENGKPKQKYIASIDRASLYFPPNCQPALRDTSIPVVFMEPEKGVMALTAAASRMHRALLPIGTRGCWNWRGRIGKATAANGARVDETGPLTDLDHIDWTSRPVIVIRDANAAIRSDIRVAGEKLAAELTSRGAQVRIVDVPIEDGINGPDDYVGTHGDAALFALMDAAKPITTNPTKRDKPEKSKQGREVQLEDPEPWPTVVDGATLLSALVGTFERYVALPKHASTALALWVLHVYTFNAWFASPFLAITSPVKRCGKTLLLIVLGAFVPRRLFASNVTPAVLFRTIEKYAPTLLVDEADTFVRDNDELRGVLNSGHTRTTAIAIRAVGDDHDPRAFSTWCPKAIALIGKLPGTLADRAIEIAMRRRTAGERVERLRQDRIDGECSHLRQQAARWAADHLQPLRDADPQVPAALHDRAADCWRPLLAVADSVGGRWPDMARESAVALSGEPADDEAGTMLLRDIHGIFVAENDAEALGSTTIIEQLVALEDRPWAEWSKGRPLSPAKLARMLAAYAIHPAGTIRIGAKTAKGYRREAFTEAWDRYLPSDGPVEVSQRNKANNDGPEPAISNRHNEKQCDALKSVTNPINTERSYGVTVSEGDDPWLDL